MKIVFLKNRRNGRCCGWARLGYIALITEVFSSVLRFFFFFFKLKETSSFDDTRGEVFVKRIEVSGME